MSKVKGKLVEDRESRLPLGDLELRPLLSHCWEKGGFIEPKISKLSVESGQLTL